MLDFYYLFSGLSTYSVGFFLGHVLGGLYLTSPLSCAHALFVLPYLQQIILSSFMINSKLTSSCHSCSTRAVKIPCSQTIKFEFYNISSTSTKILQLKNEIWTGNSTNQVSQIHIHLLVWLHLLVPLQVCNRP